MAAMIEQDAMKNETKPQTRPSELQPLTKAEHARCAAFDRRLKDKPVRFKLVESGGLALETGETGSNEWAMTCVKYAETFNTADAGLQNHLLNQVVNTFRGAHEKPEDLLRAVNTAMAMLHEIKPRDQLEVMLVVQMIAVHNQAMQLMGRASAPGQSPELRKDDLKFAVRMLRMFTTQFEALQRYRTGGQQTVTVEHVHVNAGGQAVVGTVNAGGNTRNGK